MAKSRTAPQGNQTGPDASRGYVAPVMTPDMLMRTVGSSGLRQYGGWVREEFLPNLQGRQAARTYREMDNNSATVGSITFAIQQSMRQVEWRVVPPADNPQCAEMVEFVESLMDDMTTPWSDFVSESLSMLTYGFAPHEIIYKRRMGRDPKPGLGGVKQAKSKFNDGRIGIRRLPLRGQDTVIKWFLDGDGETTGLTQQPYSGGLINLPMEKLLLFRPKAHKNNPEGRSILRTAYRPWFFLKRLEEMESIYLERMSGVPEYRIPNDVLVAAQAGDKNALAAVEQFKRIVTNIRLDEQMGLITPSDTFRNPDGTPSNVPQYEFRFVVPTGGRTAASFDPSIERYKLDIMTSVLADFLTLGHSSRGTQSLAETKVDMFFQATEGWLGSNADVLNEHLLPRIWALNGLDLELMPKFEPDMPERVDLDALSTFVLNITQAGFTLGNDPRVEDYLRGAAGLPELTEEQIEEKLTNPEPVDPTADPNSPGEDGLQKHIAGMLARRFIRKGYLSVKSGGRTRRKHR
jgi:hypothetical protein